MSTVETNDATARCHLVFRVKFESSELISYDFPVEVRRANLSFVTRVPASEGVSVEPGMYFATARLPAGQDFSRSILFLTRGGTAPDGWDGPDVVKVETGVRAKEVELTPFSGQESRHEPWDASRFLGSWSSFLPRSSRMGTFSLWESAAEADVGADDALESLGPADTEVPVRDVPVNRVRWFSGDVFGEFKPITDRADFKAVLVPGETVRVDAATSGRFEPLIMQLLRTGMAPMNVVLPVSPGIPCSVTFQGSDNSLWSLDIRLEHPTADLLLRYVQTSQWELAEVTSHAVRAEQLFRMKEADPIAATVGAYALLRFRNDAEHQTWARDFKDTFSWLPDGLAIYGEQLARAGDHARALAEFVQIPVRGLPIFGVGLSYTIDRLRLYIAAGGAKATSPFDQTMLAEARTVLKRLQPFASFAIFQSAFLTYTGLDPKTPDDSLQVETPVAPGFQPTQRR
jgi:hypothetical protein